MLDVGNKFILTVQDDGIGFDKNKISQNRIAHFGIKNIQERIAKLNGTVDWNLSETGGCVVRIELNGM